MRVRRAIAASLGLAAVGAWGGRVQANALVTLQRARSTPQMVSRPLQHRSAVLINRDDSHALQIWSVWVRYHGCGSGTRGTMRLTVFRGGAPSHVPPGSLYARRVPTRAVQYSAPVVLHGISGSAAYTFFTPARQTYFYYKVDVLSARGCSYWGASATTN